MHMKKFDLGALAEIDNGRLKSAFELALKRCEADCKDRPALGEARKLALHCELIPVADDSGDMEMCKVSFMITESLPRRRSKTYMMTATENGLMFNDLSPEDARQMTLDQAPTLKKVADAR